MSEDDNELNINIRSVIDDPSIQASLKEIINLGKESAEAVQQAFENAYTYQTEWAAKSLLVTQEDVKNFQVAQRQKLQYAKEFTTGINAELKAQVASYNAADKERLWSFQQMQKQALDAAVLADREMAVAHSAALIENTARDRAYFDSIIAQQKESVIIRKQMNADILTANILADREMAAAHSAAILENTARDKIYLQNFEANRTTEEDLFVAAQKRMNAFHAEALQLRAAEDRIYLETVNGGGIVNAGSATGAASGGSGLLSAASIGRLTQFYAIYKGIQLVTSGISGAENFVKESVLLSDKIRDTDSAIKAYSTSATQATKTQAFFTKAMDDTRLTTLELEKMYVTILPKGLQALGKSSEDTLRQVTVSLANIANLHPDIKPEEYATQFASLIGGGRFTGASALSKALGLNPDELADLKATNKDWRDDIIKLINEVGGEGAKVGKSLEAIWLQTKFSMMAAFASGFLSARGIAVDGMEAIRKILTDKSFLDDLKGAGFIFAQSFTIAADTIRIAFDVVRLNIIILKTEIGAVLSAIATNIQPLVNAGYYLNKLNPLSSAQDNKGWADIKLSVDNFAGYWHKVMADSASDVINLTKKTATDTVKLISDLNNMGKGYSSPTPHIKPDVTDNPEANAALEAAAAAKQAKIDARLQRAADAAQRRADAAKERYQKEIDKIDELTQKTRDQIDIANDLITKADDSAKAFNGNDGVVTAIDGAKIAMDKNNMAFNKNIAILDDLAPVLDKDKQKINDLKAAFEELLVTQNKIATTALWNGSVNALFTQKAGWDFTNLNDNTVKDALKSAEMASKEITKLDKERAIAYAKELKIAIKEVNVFEDAASDFIATIIEGGKHFSRAIASEYSKLIKESTKSVIDDFMQMFSGVTDTGDPNAPFSKNGKTITDPITGKAVTDLTQAIAITGKGSMGSASKAIGFAQIGAGAYVNAQQHPQGSILSGAVGGGIAGFNLAGGVSGIASGASIYGAVAGIIIGGIAAELGKAASRADYKYAAFSFTNIGSAADPTLKNQVSGSSNDNITPAAFRKMLADVQNVVDTLYNSMAKIVIDFGGLIPKINNLSGQIQPNPSGHFLENYNDWLSNTLPNQLIGEFKDGLQAIAVNVGFTVKRFTSLWAEFSKLDPAIQVQVWSDALHAAQDIQSVMAWLHGTTAVDPSLGTSRRRPSNPSAPYAGAWEQYQAQQLLPAATNPTFFTSTQADRDNMLVIGKEIQGLTGAAQVASAKQLSSLMTAYMNNSIAFMKALVDLSKTIHDDVKSKILDLTAQGMTVPDTSAGALPGAVLPDFKAQAEFYKKHADQDLLDLQNAKTPDAIAKIWSDYQATVDKVQSLQSQLGPANLESARQWAINAYNIGQGYFDRAIADAGKEVDKANAALVAELQPYINAFTGALTGLTNSIVGTTPYVAGHWEGNRFNRHWIPPVGDPNNPTGDPNVGIVGPIDKTGDAFIKLNSIIGDFSNSLINAMNILNNSVNNNNSPSSTSSNYKTQVLSIKRAA